MILFLLLAILGFCASVAVHGSTFLHASPPALGINRAWPLHIGIFLVLIPAILSERQRTGERRRRSLREDFPHAPRWMLPPLAALFVYAVVNFFVGMALMMALSPGKIVERDGQHVIVSRGVVVRPASEGEYRQDRERALRLFSGHWMLFYWMAAVGLVDGLRRRKAEAAALHARLSPQRLPTGDDRSYTLRPSTWLRPWPHATFIVFLRIVCLFGFFLAVAIPTVSLGNRADAGVLKSLGCLGFLLILPAAIFGAIVPPRWVARRLPARCPFCNGRAYCDGAPAPRRGVYGFTYTCRDCGASFRPDGSRA